MLLHGLAESVEVKGIELDGPGIGADLGHCLVLEVRTDDVVMAVDFLKVGDKLCSDLSAGTDN